MKNEITTIIKSPDLKDITIDFAEKVIDNQITGEVLSEIPILKSLFAVKKIYSSYTDSIFLKKAMNVLLELGDTNWKERVELVRDLSDEDENGTEKILMAINHLETIRKCKVFGRLCKLKAHKIIDIFDFERLTKLIQDAYLDDLVLVNNFIKGIEKEIYVEENVSLLSLGLIYQQPSEQTPIVRDEQMAIHESEFSGGEITFNYLLSDLGELLQTHYKELFPED